MEEVVGRREVASFQRRVLRACVYVYVVCTSMPLVDYRRTAILTLVILALTYAVALKLSENGSSLSHASD